MTKTRYVVLVQIQYRLDQEACFGPYSSKGYAEEKMDQLVRGFKAVLGDETSIEARVIECEYL